MEVNSAIVAFAFEQSVIFIVLHPWGLCGHMRRNAKLSCFLRQQGYWAWGKLEPQVSLNDADHMVRYDCYVSRNQDIIVIVLGVNYEHMNFVILIWIQPFWYTWYFT